HCAVWSGARALPASIAPVASERPGAQSNPTLVPHSTTTSMLLNSCTALVNPDPPANNQCCWEIRHNSKAKTRADSSESIEVFFVGLASPCDRYPVVVDDYLPLVAY